MSTSNIEQQQRQQLIDYGQALNSSGLSQGKSGNISLRCEQGLLITPTGMNYQQLTPVDIVLLDINGKVTGKQSRKPSSEWHFHCDIYRSRPEVNALVHAHSTYCTALACTGREIPAFHYMVAVAGGDNIPIAPYALFGTEKLSNYVVGALEGRLACLMANHGMLALGSDLASAFNLAQEVETLAQQYCEALKIGNVVILSEQQMREVTDKFQNYGQRV